MINMELLACSMIRIRKAGREIHGAGVLGSFIVGTTPLQSLSFACLAVAMHPLQPDFLSSIFTPSTPPSSERQNKSKPP